MARLRKPDKTPRTYDQKPFMLGSRMDLDITFGDVTMRTPVYIKTDAPDQLLLSEGVCHQLGIISYHKDIQEWRGRDKDTSRGEAGATVPAVRVSFVSSVQIPPRQSTIVEVAVDTCRGSHPVYLERDPKLEEETGLWAVDSFFQKSRTWRRWWYRTPWRTLKCWALELMLGNPMLL